MSDRVTVLMTRRGISDMTRFTPEAVEEKYGLTPVQYPDFAALRGDPSDNLPNIPGVGEKTATKWVSEYGDLDTLVARVDEVPGKAGDALRIEIMVEQFDNGVRMTLARRRREFDAQKEIARGLRESAALPTV